MSDKKILLAFEKTEKALKQLQAILKKPLEVESGTLDAAIQRFEFSFELFWKLLKTILEHLHKEVYAPRDVLKLAYQDALIANETAWLTMLSDRNLTSHTYNEDLAFEIASRLPAHFELMNSSFHKLKEKN